MAILSGLTISDGGLTIYGPGSAPPPAANDPYFMYNSLLLPGNGTNNAQNNTFLDGSTNNFTLTRAGNTTQGTFSPYGGNWSNYFNGTGGNFLIAPTTSIQGSDFTIEGWFYTTNLGATKTIASDYQNSTNGWTIVLTTSNIISVSLSGDGADISGSTVVNVNQWYHFALCGSGGTGSTIKLYLNGVQEGSTYSGSTALNSTQGTSIGQLRYLGSNYDPFYGYISNVRIVKGTAVYTSNFTPPTTPLTAITNTSLLTSQSNRLVDNSINNYTITLYGSVPVQRFSPFDPSTVTPTSYSGYFDGTGDYISVADNVAFTMGSGDFTIECWVYLQNVAQQIFIGTCDAGGNQGSMSFVLGLDGSSYPVVGVGYGGTLYKSTFGTVLTTNRWYHIAGVRNGAMVNVYVDGVKGPDLNMGTLAITDSTQTVAVGRNGAGNFEYVTGYISNARIVKGTAVYTSAFTPPTSPLTAISGTSLLTCQNTTFIDNSTNNFTITAAGNSQPTQQNPFGYTSATTEGYTTSTIGGSGYFDGTGDYLTGPSNNTAFQLTSNGGTGFTVEAWIYPIGGSGTYRLISSYYSYTDGGAEQGWMLRLNTSDQVEFGNRFASAAVSGGTAPLNSWTHVAGIVSGTTIYLYVNGVSVGTPTALGSQNYSGTVFAVAAAKSNGSYTSYNFPGYISDVRTSTAVLYASNFVPSSAPLTAIASTSLLANMTNAGIIDNAMMNDLETVGNAQISTTQSKFGGSSIVFDGTGDYLKAPYNPVYSLPGDFTVETWIYLTSAAGTGNQTIASFGYNNSTGAGPWGFYLNGTGPYTLYFNSSSGNHGSSTTVAIPINTWTHVTYCRSGTTGRFFVDGTIVGTTISDNFTYSGTTQSLFVGIMSDASSAPLYGYIDDLRITKGYARYTSNFSVPTEAFPTY